MIYAFTLSLGYHLFLFFPLMYFCNLQSHAALSYNETICKYCIVPQGRTSPLKHVIILPSATSPLLPLSLPSSCSHCCIPAAVIHSVIYLLCILYSHSPCFSPSLSSSSAFSLSLSVIASLPLLHMFHSAHLFCLSFSALSLLPVSFFFFFLPLLITEPLRSPFSRSGLLMPRLRLMKHCQALPSKLCVRAPCVRMGKR